VYNNSILQPRCDEVKKTSYPLSKFCNIRDDITCLLLKAKEKESLTFQQIANYIGGSKEWVAAVMLGQASMNKKDALMLTKILNVDSSIAPILQEAPMRGSLNNTVPVDPLIYRFYEVMQIYGTTFKVLINEMFGDGIFSAINFKFKVDKTKDPIDPEAERVVITFDGKFLPYEKF